MLVYSWWSVVYLVKMKCESLSNHLVTFFGTLFSVIDAFLILRDWMICWHISDMYLVCFKNNICEWSTYICRIGFLYRRTSIISRRRLKPIIKLFDSGWSYMLYLSFKLILLLVIWLYNCNITMKKKIPRLGTSKVQAYRSTLNIFLQWISKPRIRKPKNHCKSSSGTGRFAQNLRACKKSQYNVWNCKSRRNNRQHTFKYRVSQFKPISTNIPYNDLMVIGRKNDITKAPSPRKRNRMLCSLNHCQDITVSENTKLKSSLLPFEELNMDNGDLSKIQNMIIVPILISHSTMLLTKLIRIPIC